MRVRNLGDLDVARGYGAVQMHAVGRVNTMMSEQETKFYRPSRCATVVAVMLGLTSLTLQSCTATPSNPVASSSSTQLATDEFALLPRFLSGVWRVAYRNGAIRTYVFQPDGKVQFVEVNLHCTLCTRPEVLLSFDDGKIERLWISGDEFRVEHWNPATDYPGGEPLTGIGRRLHH